MFSSNLDLSKVKAGDVLKALTEVAPDHQEISSGGHKYVTINSGKVETSSLWWNSASLETITTIVAKALEGTDQEEIKKQILIKYKLIVEKFKEKDHGNSPLGSSGQSAIEPPQLDSNTDASGTEISSGTPTNQPKIVKKEGEAIEPTILAAASEAANNIYAALYAGFRNTLHGNEAEAQADLKEAQRRFVEGSNQVQQARSDAIKAREIK